MEKDTSCPGPASVPIVLDEEAVTMALAQEDAVTDALDRYNRMSLGERRAFLSAIATHLDAAFALEGKVYWEYYVQQQLERVKRAAHEEDYVEHIKQVFYPHEHLDTTGQLNSEGTRTDANTEERQLYLIRIVREQIPSAPDDIIREELVKYKWDVVNAVLSLDERYPSL